MKNYLDFKSLYVEILQFRIIWVHPCTWCSWSPCMPELWTIYITYRTAYNERLSLLLLELMRKSSSGAKIGGTAFWQELAPSWQAYPFTLWYNAVQHALKAQIGGGPGLSFSRYWSLSQSHNKLFGGVGGGERSVWLRLEQVWREHWDILYFEWLAFFYVKF